MTTAIKIHENNQQLKVVRNSNVVECLKSKKAIFITPDQLWIEQDYNIRELSQEHITGFILSYMNGLFVPPIEVEEVMVENERKYKVVKGRHRALAIRKAMEIGYSCEQIEAVLIEGDEVSLFLRMIQSSNGRKLNPIEMAHAYDRLISYGLNQAEVAVQMNVTSAQVSNYLQLLKAPPLLQEWIKAGKYSTTKAHNMIRKHGAEIAMALAIEDEKVRAERDKMRISGKKLGRVRSSVLSDDFKLNEKTIGEMSDLVVGMSQQIPQDLSGVEGNIKLKVSPEIASVLKSLSLRVFSVSSNNQMLENTLQQKALSLKNIA